MSQLESIDRQVSPFRSESHGQQVPAGLSQEVLNGQRRTATPGADGQGFPIPAENRLDGFLAHAAPEGQIDEPALFGNNDAGVMIGDFQTAGTERFLEMSGQRGSSRGQPEAVLPLPFRLIVNLGQPGE